MKKIGVILLAVPFAVIGERTATDAMAGQYSPPILANGDIGMLIDYRNCQFQDVPSYKTIHAVGEKYLPGIYRAARRTENGKLAAFGRIEEHVSLPGDADAKPVSWRQMLDITNALSICENVYADGVRIDSTAFVAQHTAVIAVEKRFAGDVERYAFDYVFRRTGTDARLPLNTTATFKPGEVAFSIDREKNSIDGTVTVFSDAPAARAETIDKGLRLTLDRPRGTVRFFLVFRDSLDARKPDVVSVRAAGWDGLLRAHTDAWRTFWGDTYISIPDARIQEMYYTALYNLKCWSTAWSIPVGILPTHWHGAFFGFTFFGPALCASGHVPEAVKVAKFWGSEAHRRSAHARAGNVKRSPDCGLRYNWETLEDFSEFSKKGRWLDHYLHLGNISLECWTAWRYTGDRDLLRDTVYPVVKGCAQYFQTHLVWETKDGRTILGPLCDLERLPCPVRNAYLTTCGAIFCFEKAAEGAKLLGVDGAEAAEWRRLAAALRRDLPSDGTRYLPFEGAAERSVGVLSGILPYGTVPVDDPRQRAAIADFEQNGLSVGNMYSVGTRICTWYAAWLAGAQARLGDGEGAYRNLKRAAASAGAFAEIFEINEPAYRSCPWCSSPQGTFVQAVNEMLLQGEGDGIKLAPAVPASWRDFAFRLRAPGGQTVEAVFHDGACVKRTVEFDIRDFGAAIDAKPAVNAAAIQRAIDGAEKAGGGTVVVPSGTFTSGTIWLKRNVELHLAEGSVLKASGDLADYNRADAYPENWGCPPEYWNGCHFIIAREADGASITGKGTIHGNGDAFYDDEPRAYYSWMKPGSNAWWNGIRWAKDKKNLRPGQLIVFVKCRDVAVRGITIRNSPCWSLWFWGCERVRVSDYTVRNGENDGNSDGIDFDCSRDVVLERADIDTGDDAIAVRASARAFSEDGKGRLGAPALTEGVRIRDCRLRSTSSVFRIGVGEGTIRDVSVENVTCDRGGTAVNISTRYGEPKRAGTDIERVVFRNCHFTNCRAGAVVRSNGGDHLEFGIRDIRFEDCSFGGLKPSVGSDRGVRFPVDPKQVVFVRVPEAELPLEQGFLNPPQTNRPQVWWWFDATAPDAAITRDLEGLKRVGISGFHIYGGSVTGKGWLPRAKWALHEANRLGLDGVVCIGAAGCGHAQTEPRYAQKDLVFSEARMNVCGAPRAAVTLPRKGVKEAPKNADGSPKYYWDITVLAVPDTTNDVPLAEVRDVSRYLNRETGAFEWPDAPGGKWRILRVGYVPKVFGWMGCYIDHMSKEAFDAHWARVMTPLLEALAPDERAALKGVMCDSWEAGTVSWTDTFAEEFRRRRGYDILPWLPVKAGVRLVSGPKRARFLRDFNETVSELIAENHYAYQKEVANRHGLVSIAEAAGPHQRQGDVRRMQGRCDVAMGEFWMPSGHRPLPPQRFMVRDAANAAHVYGMDEVLAEAFTTINTYWIESPATMKPCADRAFCDGLTRVCYHGMKLSPSLTDKPGFIRNVGTHYNPQTTWFDQSGAFNLYLSRCSWMLSRGRFAADCLLYAGDAVNLFAGLKTPSDGLGEGFDYDFCPTELLLQARVEDGQVVLPSGMRYRVLMLSDRNPKTNGHMRPGPMKKVQEYPPVGLSVSEAAMLKMRELVEAGATLVGPRPSGPTSMNESSERYHAAADVLWGPRLGRDKRDLSRQVGKGRVFRDRAAARATLTPDVSFAGPSLDWIHRTLSDGTDIYFVSNQKGEVVKTTVIFRQPEGKAVELWNAVTGARSAAGCAEPRVEVELPPYGSTFVVFRSRSSATLPLINSSIMRAQQAVPLPGPWSVTFDPAWGGPKEPVAFTELTDWTTRPESGIRHYSGTAIYRTTFDAPLGWKQGEPLQIDLGMVHEVADVLVNGKMAGTAWTAPYAVTASNVKEKGNVLEVRVTNLWPNRLIYDAGLPEGKRLTHTNINPYKPGDPLLPSGLLGPVQIRSCMTKSEAEQR